MTHQIDVERGVSCTTLQGSTGVSRRSVMSALSVAAIPAIPSLAQAEACAVDRADARLIELGKLLEAEWQVQRGHEAESKRLHRDDPRFQNWLRQVRYRPESAADRRLVELLGEGPWGPERGFCAPSIDRLSEISAALDGAPVPLTAAEKRRLSDLVAARGDLEEFQAEEAVVLCDDNCDATGDRVSAIVDLIEAESAKTLHGLLVKVNAVRWCRTGDLDADVSGDATDMRILQTILCDLAAMDASSQQS